MADDLTAATTRMRGVIETAFRRLLTRIRIYVTGHSYDLPDDADDETTARWRTILDNDITPELAVVITTAAHEESNPRDLTPGEGDTQDWADAYLKAVDNRLAGVADTTWAIIRDSLREGRSKGEGIPELAKRVDGLLGDDQRWSKRAETIARTEVIGANSAGHYAAAGWTADQLDVDHADIVKGWLDTHDSRTRPTHRAAGGQHVKGLDARFRVGEALMLRPHDPAAPPDETIDCRCSTVYLMPGDPGYDDALTAGGTMTEQFPDDVVRLAAEVEAGRWGSLLSRLEVQDREKMLASIRFLAAATATYDVSQMPPKLKAHWLTNIAWGHPGDFKECQAALVKYVPAEMVDGACANLHNEATGHYPGPGKGTSADTAAYAETPPPIPVQPDGTVKPGHLPAGTKPTSTNPEDADEPPTGVVIVALPAKDDGSVHTIGPEEKHATILYLGDQDTLGVGQNDDVAAVVEKLAQSAAPFSVAVSDVESLGDDNALVWMLKTGSWLDDQHTALRADPVVADAGNPDDMDSHPTFTPHVTIGYPDDQSDDVQDDAWPAIKDAAADVTGIRFDRLALWWGTDRREYPLSGGKDPAPADAPGDKQEDPPVTAAATETDQPDGEAALPTWRGPLCPEGVVTGDKRKFADGGIEWMETPGVLKAQFSDLPGHDGSVGVGLIRGVERTDDGRLWAVGTWDTGEQAVEARRLNKAGLMRGVSVDLDSTEFHLEDPDGNPIEGDDMFDLMFDGGPEPTVVVDKGRLRAATLCYMPAYVEAYILDDDLPDTDAPKTSIVDAPAGKDPVAIAASAAITAAATAELQTAPAAAFTDPGLTEPTKLTFTDDGRFFGHLACWGVCHIGIAGACVTPPESATGYAYMLTGMYATSDGDVIPVGTLTMGTGHADLDIGWLPTVDHYDHTGTAAGYFSIGQDAHGIWIAGAVAEDLPDPMRLAMQRAGSVSGDWREIGGNLELVAALVVNVPGFPIPAVRARVASAGRSLVASGIVHPPGNGLHVPSGVSIATLAREVAAYQARADRSAAADRRLRAQRATQLAARL